MPSVTVIVYKGQRSDEAEQQAAALAASLTKASGPGSHDAAVAAQLLTV